MNQLITLGRNKVNKKITGRDECSPNVYCL